MKETKKYYIQQCWQICATLYAQSGIPESYTNTYADKFPFTPKVSIGYRLDECKAYYEHYKAKYSQGFALESATEKQINLLLKLTKPEKDENEERYKLVQSGTFTKVAASKLISLLIEENNLVYSRYSTFADFEQIDTIITDFLTLAQNK